MASQVASLRPSDRDPNWRKRPRFWTAERVFRLDELIRQGRSDESIARALGTTANGVMLARKRRKIPARSTVLFTARAVARTLGVGCAKTIVRWIEAGWLRGRRGQRMGLYRMWYVTEEALWDFISNPAAWHAWDAARIPEPELRELALSVRAGETWLTPGEVADRCFVSHMAVNQWIRRGTLPAVRYGNWRIRESDLRGFVPPGQRDRTGRRAWRFDAEEDATILTMRAAGATWQAIADELGRPLGSVAGRHGRLMVVAHATADTVRATSGRRGDDLMVPNVPMTWIAWRNDEEYFAACRRKRDLERCGVVVVLMDERWRNEKPRAARVPADGEGATPGEEAT